MHAMGGAFPYSFKLVVMISCSYLSMEEGSLFLRFVCHFGIS
jgi:hypothetical protein